MFLRIASLLAILIAFNSSTVFGQATDGMERWIRQLRDPAPSYRAQAAVEIGRHGSEAHVALPALFDRIQDIDANVRLCTVQTLAMIGQSPVETAQHLLVALSDKDEHVRYAAEWAMARIALLPTARSDARELAAIFRQAIATVTQRPHHARHRQVVEEAIRDLGDLIAKLDAEAAQETAEQLTLRQMAESIRDLQRQFELSDRNTQFQLIAQLHSIDEPNLANVVDEVRQSMLKHAILSNDLVCVVQALRVWGDAGTQVMMAIFESLPETQALPDWTAEVIARCTPQSASDLSKLRNIAHQTGNSVAVRSSALEALAFWGSSDRHCLEFLLSVATHDRDESVRTIAMRALATCEPRLAREVMQQQILSIVRNPSESWYIRSVAAQCLAELSPSSMDAVDSFVSAATEQTIPDYRLSDVCRVLGQFEVLSAGGHALLVRALEADDEPTRAAAANAIANLGLAAKSLVPNLIAQFTDGSQPAIVKEASIHALSAMGPDAISTLAEKLPLSQDQPTIEALQAIALLGPNAASALPNLIALVDTDENSLPVRSAATFAIGRLGPHGVPASPVLRKLLSSTTCEAAQTAAVIALSEIGAISADEIQFVLPGAYDNSVHRSALEYARYRSGEEKQSLTRLVDELNGSDAEYAGMALEDIGSATAPSLMALVHDRERSAEHRVKAFGILTKIPSRDYQPLISTLADPEIGSQCASMLAGSLSSDASLSTHKRENLLGTLASYLTTESNMDVRKRLEQVAFALTAGGGESEALRTPSMLTNSLQQEIENDFYSQIAAASAEAVVMELEAPAAASSTNIYVSTGQPELDGHRANELPAFGSLGFNNGQQPFSFETTTNANENRTPPELEASEQVSPFPPPALPLTSNPEHATTVKVFYGTNRMPLVPLLDSEIDDNARRKLVAVIAAVAVIAVCLFGFLRQRSATYAAFAICGLLTVGIFGLQHHFSLTANEQPIASSESYGGGFSDQITLGICEVSIPDSHLAGELEAPSIFRFEIKEDASKHIILQQTQPLQASDFYSEIDSELAQKGKNLLVFVHGYNVTFEDAARRTAQMAFDLNFEGAPVFYSWPSQANWYQYQQDKKNIELSVKHIRDFLVDLAEKTGAEKINLVAHSMGSAGLTAALSEIESQTPRFNEVVLAAPDIDADIFKSRIAPKIVGKAKRFTLYTSSSDLALVASRYFNSGKRAGESDQPVLEVPGIDVIDASGVDTSLLGHSYYGESVSVLRDLGELFSDRPAAQRTYVRIATGGGKPYWIFDSPFVADRNPKSDVELR